MGGPREARENLGTEVNIAVKEGGLAILAGLSLAPGLLGSGLVIPHLLCKLALRQCPDPRVDVGG